jgi:Flp pilus assembly protein TadD
MQPIQPDAQDVLARAQFAQAEFGEAADTYRRMLADSTANPVLVERYAVSLAAAERRTAASEFRGWLESVRGEKPRNAVVEQAGLDLLSGEVAAARRFEADLNMSGDAWAPDYVGELGWWYYLGGDYSHASQLLSTAVQQRPADIKMWVRLAFAEIETRRLSDSIQIANHVIDQRGFEGERAMALAIAFWQAKEPENALSEFGVALARQPEWGNHHWVEALYSPLVVHSVQEMQAERERQRKERMAAKR